MKNELTNNRHYKILIVDDQEILLAILGNHIEALGYQTVMARDGSEALEKIESEKPDLILLDIIMPGIDGYEVCKLIKDNKETRDIPVIIVTSLAKTDDLVKALECGADDFLNKSFNPVELKARVRSLLLKKSINDEVKSAYRHINDLTQFADSTLTHISFEDFSIERSHRNLAAKLLKTETGETDKPTHLIIGRLAEDKTVNADLYSFNEGKIDIHKLSFTYRETLFNLDNRGIEIINYDSPCSGEGRFDEQIIHHIGIIGNCITFKPNETDDILFAFNYETTATSHLADILTSFMMTSHVFKTVSKQMDETGHAFRYMVTALARAAEVNDEGTGNHLLRVNEYATIIAIEMKMPSTFVNDVGFFAQMHDVGKIHVTRDLLRKPGKLTDDEFEIMKKHPTYGAKILGEEPRLKMAREIALYHHERYDGTGYPAKVIGEDIPLSARIVTIGDIYDALRSKRAYKPAFSHKKTVDIITKGDGRTSPNHFDPQVLQAFIRKEGEFERVYKQLTEPGEN